MEESFGKGLSDFVFSKGKSLISEISKSRKEKLPKFSEKEKEQLKKNRSELRKLTNEQGAAVMDKACEEAMKSSIMLENAINFQMLALPKNVSRQKRSMAAKKFKELINAGNNGADSFLNRMFLSTEETATVLSDPSKAPWCVPFFKRIGEAQEKMMKEAKEELNKSIGIDIGSGHLAEAIMKKEGATDQEIEELREDSKEVLDCLDSFMKGTADERCLDNIEVVRTSFGLETKEEAASLLKALI